MHLSFKDEIWGADVVNIQLISDYNERFRFLLCASNTFSKSAWVVFLKLLHILLYINLNINY